MEVLTLVLIACLALAFGLMVANLAMTAALRLVRHIVRISVAKDAPAMGRFVT
jgi:hypothetical protein